MNKVISVFQLLSFPLVLLMGITACQKEKKVPFPENASGFKVPVTKPFTMPEAKPIEWKDIDPFLIPKGITFPLDFDKLQYKDFSINAFKSLPKPIETRPLNWESLEEININLDTLKGQSFTKKISLLPEPTITKVVAPTKWEGSTSGIVRLGQTEGLIGNYIYAMVTDDYGSIWFSTEKGLARYMGDEFKTYDLGKREENGNNETITDLEISHDGKLLVTGYGSGLYTLDIPTGIIEHAEIIRGFSRIKEDHDGVLWLSNFEHGLFFIKPGQDIIYEFDIPSENINNDLTLGVFEDSHDNMWVGYSNHVVILNPERSSLKIVVGDQDLRLATPFEFTEDLHGNIWLSSLADQAKSISIDKGQINILGKDQDFEGGAKGVLEDALGNIWIMDNNYLTIYNPQSNKIKKLPTEATFRVNGWPTTAIKDQDGMIWIGSQNIGALIIDPFGPLAGHFDKGDGLASDDVWGMAEDYEERVWLATYKGLNVYDQKNERLYHLKNLEKSGVNDFRGLSNIGDKQLFAGGVGGFAIIDLKNKITTIYQMNDEVAPSFLRAVKDQEGNLWINTNRGIIKFNPEENALQQFNIDNGLASNLAYFMIPDAEGNIWVIMDAGLVIINPTKNTFSYISDKDGLILDDLAAAVESYTGEMVVGGIKGLSIISKDRTQITNITAENGLLPEVLYDLSEYNNKIRVGSENGLIVVERPTNRDSTWSFINYNKREGFPFNDYNQQSSLYTKSGTAWHAATPSLTVITQDPILSGQPPAVSITGMNIMDHHPSFQDKKSINTFLAEVDTLWNTNETEIIPKNKLVKDTTYLATHNIKWDSINASTQMPIGLKLPSTENSLSFYFSNTSVQGRDKIVYRYFLEGADDAWSGVTAKAISKNYYNLSPGKYAFKVATRGFSGYWSKPTTFAFTILPPWWQTWWAYGLFIILGGIVIGAVVQVRSQWLKRENRILEERVSHRTAQLKKSIDDLKNTQSQLVQSEKMASLGELTAGIAHEIQNPLNFVNNFSEINTELIDELEEELNKGNIDEVKLLAKDIKENEQKINHHGKRADGIVKGMLQHSRASSGIKEPTDINVLADEYLRLAYHGLRAKDKSFNAKFETNFDNTLGKIDVVSQDMGRVILNLITNAFYAVAEKQKSQMDSSYEPSVTVTTKNLGNKVEIRVKDNGNGIPKSALDKIYQPFFTTKPTGQGTGLGLSMSYDIVTKSHDGELNVETKENEGTEFIITLSK